MKYFSTLRPVSIGTYPKPQGNRVDAIVNFDEPIFIAEIGSLHGGTSSTSTH